MSTEPRDPWPYVVAVILQRLAAVFMLAFAIPLPLSNDPGLSLYLSLQAGLAALGLWAVVRLLQPKTKPEAS